MTTVGYDRQATDTAPEGAIDDTARPTRRTAYPETTLERFEQRRNDNPGIASEEIPQFASQSGQQWEDPTLASQFSGLLSGILDNFSFLFFCVSFSSLTHLLGSWCSRFLAEE